MPTTSRTHVDGLRELGESMRALSADVAKRISGQATFAAAKIVKTAAVSTIQHNASRDGDSIETGSLRDAVITKKLPKGQLGPLTAAHIVTVRGRGKPKNKKGQHIARAPHANLVEFGTVNMPAEPFLRPALANNQRQALTAMTDKLRARIAKVKPK